MGKKQLNTEGIASELQEASAFFSARPRPVETKPTPQDEHPAQPARAPQPIQPQSPVAVPVSTNEESVEIPTIRSIDHTNERTKVRHSFDVFTDQLLTLRQLALTRETVTGKRVLLGDLVQEAIDMLIRQETGR